MSEEEVYKALKDHPAIKYRGNPYEPLLTQWCEDALEEGYDRDWLEGVLRKQILKLKIPNEP